MILFIYLKFENNVLSKVSGSETEGCLVREMREVTANWTRNSDKNVNGEFLKRSGIGYEDNIRMDL
jgi:hypothetical protein